MNILSKIIFNYLAQSIRFKIILVQAKLSNKYSLIVN
ncbi:MAG: hypothetical protein RLZZ171_613 [Cyanobacteriota bacterium]|jgi:hypothetical protein